MKKILFAASECVPFIKTGGLADVVGSLPKYFDKNEFDCRVILPKYACMKYEWVEKLEYLTNFWMYFCGRDRYVGLFRLVHDGVTFYFIDNEEYFGGPKPYDGGKWDLEKFGYFSRAVLSALPVLDFRPDLIHCHDWQTGLIPVYLKDSFNGGDFFRGIRSVMTIHNLKFQGVWDVKTIQGITGLSDYYFSIDKLKDFENGNYLKGGIVYADAITTVSRSYAEEIKTPFYGEGLDGLMRARANSLRGIVNGIDYDEWNPETDNKIAQHFNVSNFRQLKKKNKVTLQKELGLREDPNVMMIGLVSRLTDQKGLDLVDYVFGELCTDEVQFVILGTGDAKYEQLFRYYAWKYPDKVSANIRYEEGLSHMIYASCDAFLMPSLFEPCGLSQLMSLRYGTLPIVRETGGLKDTVEPYNEFEDRGTGFSFYNYNAHEMMATVRYAERIFYDNKTDWNRMVERAMNQDFSWKTSAKAYEEMYNYMLGW